MSHLAEVHYRQARSFMRAGDSKRAVELLEKARVLVRNDRDLLARVLEDLVAAYDATGQAAKAALWRDELARLKPAPAAALAVAPAVMTKSFAPLGNTPRSRSGLLPVIVAASMLIGVGGAILALRFWPTPPTPIALAPSTLPTTTPIIGNFRPPTSATTLATTAPATTTPAPAGVAVSTTRPSAPDTKIDRQQLLKENVGLVVVLLRYEGTANRRPVKIDVPLGMGTAFAVHPTGVLLTNKHVVDAGGAAASVPVTLEDAGLPTVTLRGTSYLVCFGPTESERFPAKLVYKSDQYDVAVLKVNHPFVNPLALAARPLRQGEDILCCGFPGAVTQALNQAAKTPRRVVETSRKWQQTGYVDPFDQFSPDSFNSTLTRGIVSAPERNVRGVSYLQMDAAISAGNSGGPVLNSMNEVVGIATFGLRNDAMPLTNYNFALLLDQVRSEIDPFITEKN